MTEDFNKWWNTDGLVEDNPYTRDTPAFWAWEGWQAGAAAEREWQGLTDEEVKKIYTATEIKVEDHWRTGGTTMMFPTAIYQAIEQALQEKNT